MILTTIWSNPFDNAIEIAFSNFFDILPSKIKEGIAIFSALGNLGIFLLIAGILLLLFKQTRKIGFICLLSVFSTLIFNDLIFKNIFDRARPFQDPNLVNQLQSIVNNNGEVYGLKPDSPSFPSGHTFQSFAAFGAILFYYFKDKENKKSYIPSLVFFGIYAFLMGISRVLLSHHYFTDVLAGAILGGLSGILVYYVIEYTPVLYNKLMSKFKKNEN